MGGRGSTPTTVQISAHTAPLKHSLSIQRLCHRVLAPWYGLAVLPSCMVRSYSFSDGELAVDMMCRYDGMTRNTVVQNTDTGKATPFRLYAAALLLIFMFIFI